MGVHNVGSQLRYPKSQIISSFVDTLPTVTDCVAGGGRHSKTIILRSRFEPPVRPCLSLCLSLPLSLPRWTLTAQWKWRTSVSQSISRRRSRSARLLWVHRTGWPRSSSEGTPMMLR